MRRLLEVWKEWWGIRETGGGAWRLMDVLGDRWGSGEDGGGIGRLVGEWRDW